MAQRRGTVGEGKQEQSRRARFPLVARIALALLILWFGAGCSDGQSPGDSGSTAGPIPDQPEWSPGRPYPYRTDTTDRYRALLGGDSWARAIEERNPEGLLLVTHVPTNLVFVLIPGGAFRMGSPESEAGREPDEGPGRVVTIEPFLLARTEVRRDTWGKGGGRLRADGSPSAHPANRVSWGAARVWCEGSGLRLPSEAEWEYACRARTETPWFFGEDPADLPIYACSFRRNYAPLAPVASLRPNPFGLYDILGNLAEWCEDRWHDDYTDAPRDGSAWTEGESPIRVLRGGHYFALENSCRSASRRAQAADLAAGYNGLRPAATLP